jgi:hypothetical protein
MGDKITDIIAERELTFVHENGKRYSCRLVFGKTYEEQVGVCCPFQLLGDGYEKIYKIYGEDSLQAFLLATEMANVTLHHHSRRKIPLRRFRGYTPKNTRPTSAIKTTRKHNF